MYNEDDFKKPIIKQKTRIFRPYEWERLMRGCSKIEYKTMLEALLYTGMRYIEMQHFQTYPSWFDGDFVHLPRELATKKRKRKQEERWVRLNNQGKMAIRHFISLDKKLPSYQSWNENLKCWCRRANLDIEGISVKSTRKTWESWLMFYYPERIMDITSSQGHTQTTSLQHYCNMPFTDRDELEIKQYVEGWVTKKGNSL